VLDDLISDNNDAIIPARHSWVCDGLAAHPEFERQLRADPADGALAPSSRATFLAKMKAQFDHACQGSKDEAAVQQQVASALGYIANGLQVAAARKGVLRHWYQNKCRQ
jgi:hypothetical protein